jgi:hypothetical protein
MSGRNRSLTAARDWAFSAMAVVVGLAAPSVRAVSAFVSIRPRLLFPADQLRAITDLKQQNGLGDREFG